MIRKEQKAQGRLSLFNRVWRPVHSIRLSIGRSCIRDPFLLHLWAPCTLHPVRALSHSRRHLIRIRIPTTPRDQHPIPCHPTRLRVRLPLDPIRMASHQRQIISRRRQTAHRRGPMDSPRRRMGKDQCQTVSHQRRVGKDQ